MNKVKFIVCLLSIYLVLAVSSVYAQSYKYMDASGNINFVDRFEDVPLKYRNQIPGFIPTPGFVMDKKEKAKLDREALKKEREKEKQRKKREKQLQKQEQERRKKLSRAEIRQLQAEERQNKLEQKQGLRNRNEKEEVVEEEVDKPSAKRSERENSSKDEVEAIQ